MIRLFTFACCVVFVMLTGCASMDLTQSHEPSAQKTLVTITPTSDIYINQATANLKDNQLTIAGSIRRDRLFRGDYHGHVDVMLTDAKGQILKSVQTEYSTGLLIPDGIRRTRFSVVLPVDSTIPSHVVVKVHDEKECAL